MQSEKDLDHLVMVFKLLMALVLFLMTLATAKVIRKFAWGSRKGAPEGIRKDIKVE